MSTARRLFAERGYANVSAAEIVSAAGLTRGALYHHYADKKALFHAVLIELDDELIDQIGAAMRDAGSTELGMVAAVSAYLDLCSRPEVVRLVLTDAPAVLGWHEWRAIEAEHGLGLIREMLVPAQREGRIVGSVDLLAQLILSAVTEAALYVAHAENTEQAKEEARIGLLTLLGGALRAG
jgi:AcrR family transcriptional regulator